MTREEAIEVLTHELCDWECDCKSYHVMKDALRMAIEALEREPSEDLINRAEAIKVIELVDWYHQNKNKDMVYGANSDEHRAWYKAADVYRALEAVPPADKQRNGDLISRQDAIETAGDWMVKEFGYLDLNRGERLIDAIEALPSADRPKGRWHYSDGKPATIGQSFGVICDQCGTESEYCTNFCGECGADMRGEDK